MKQMRFLKLALLTLVFGLLAVGCTAMEGEPAPTTMEDEVTASPTVATTASPTAARKATESPTGTLAAMGEGDDGDESMDDGEGDDDSSMATFDCYSIAMVDMMANEDGTSTWQYEVEELECAQDLSYWVLELPDCVSVVSASGEYEMVDPDPNTDLKGIKWQTGAGFESGTFEVVLDAQYEMDDVQAAVKGPDVAYGEIAGPGCEVEDGTEDDESMDDGEDDDDSSMATFDCYRIAMVDMMANEDGTSTWQYEVEELECAQDLSYWVLELPDCVSVLSASGEYEMVDPDPNTDLKGIKWQTGAGFESGTFEVVLDAQYEMDDVRAAVKGPDVTYGEVAGPGCEVEDGTEDDESMDDGDDDDDADDADDTDYGDSVCEDLDIDPGALPPPGECKVWDPDLPAGQQGSPVECDCSNLVPGTCLIDSDGDVVDCD